MTQFEGILSLVKANGGEVDCGTLSRFGYFHKAASRLGVEAVKKGYQFEYVPGETWDKAKYKLVSEPKEPIKFDETGQSAFL